MKVSIIGGTGPQGLGIGERLAIAGVDVIIGSRKEEKALDVVAKAKEELADYDLSMVGLVGRKFYEPSENKQEESLRSRLEVLWPKYYKK